MFVFVGPCEGNSEIICIPKKSLSIVGFWLSKDGLRSQMHFNSYGDHNFSFQLRGNKTLTLTLTLSPSDLSCFETNFGVERSLQVYICMTTVRLLWLAAILKCTKASCPLDVLSYAPVKVGIRSTCVKGEEGMRCFGSGRHGLLGNGDLLNYLASNSRLVDFGNNRMIEKFDDSVNYHMCAIFNDSSSQCWGYALDGKLGNGDSVNDIGDDEPLTSVPLLNHGSGNMPIFVKIGNAHTCFIYSNGNAKCVGKNDFGQLSDNSEVSKSDFSVIPEIQFALGDTPMAVEVGDQHTCWLYTNTKSQCCGRCDLGA